MRYKLKQTYWRGYAQSILILVIATLIGQLLRPFVAPTNLVMLYLLVVVISSGRWGYGPAILTSLLSVFVFNFFFVPHEYTLQVADAQYVLTFIGLFIVGITIADLTHRVHQQMAAAQRREAQTAELYGLSRDLVATIDETVITQAVLKHIRETFHSEAAIYLYQDKQLQLKVQTSAFALANTENNIAQWAFEHSKHAGCGTDNWSACSIMCIPLVTVHAKIGVLILKIDPELASRSDYRHLVDAFANQAALAIEAAHLAVDVQQNELLRDREKMQTILLNSISHDLRTPLVSIAGALSTLRDKTLQIPDSAKEDMLDGAWQEVQRLNRTVANLLDMTRLQSGMLHLKRDWFHVQELIANARYQLSDRLKQRRLIIDVPSELPFIEIDMTLMIQVIVNLLDNAIKYSQPDTQIEIHARCVDNHVIIEIGDEGVTIPESDLPHIFEKFYRAHRDGGIAGTGLGLSICEGIVTMHGGTIEARNRPEGGTIFQISLALKESAMNRVSV